MRNSRRCSRWHLTPSGCVGSNTNGWVEVAVPAKTQLPLVRCVGKTQDLIADPHKLRGDVLPVRIGEGSISSLDTKNKQPGSQPALLN